MIDANRIVENISHLLEILAGTNLIQRNAECVTHTCTICLLSWNFKVFPWHSKSERGVWYSLNVEKLDCIGLPC